MRFAKYVVCRQFSSEIQNRFDEAVMENKPFIIKSYLWQLARFLRYIHDLYTTFSFSFCIKYTIHSIYYTIIYYRLFEY